jgi:hypothetical protein
METLIGLMLLVAFLGTLDLKAIFSRKNNYTSPAASEPEREKISLLH